MTATTCDSCDCGCWTRGLVEGERRGLLREVNEHQHTWEQSQAKHAEIDGLEQALVAAKVCLKNCEELFTEIRNDWSDPRFECRSGREQIRLALNIIASVTE